MKLIPNETRVSFPFTEVKRGAGTVGTFIQVANDSDAEPALLVLLDEGSLVNIHYSVCTILESVSQETQVKTTLATPDDVATRKALCTLSNCKKDGQILACSECALELGQGEEI